ncbi:Ribonucleoside-diphosphate reductase 2 subunit alpha, partial [Clarias magur]
PLAFCYKRFAIIICGVSNIAITVTASSLPLWVDVRDDVMKYYNVYAKQLSGVCLAVSGDRVKKTNSSFSDQSEQRTRRTLTKAR